MDGFASLDLNSFLWVVLEGNHRNTLFGVVAHGRGDDSSISPEPKHKPGLFSSRSAGFNKGFEGSLELTYTGAGRNFRKEMFPEDLGSWKS